MGGQLVVVVTKAQDLPNRRKLDKQSPYCVARIQDQVQKTKVIPRGGQNPQWDDEMRFSLDNLSTGNNKISFFIYHQLKKEDGLVCKAEIDFTNALNKSSKEGYDSWFQLEYENRPAGKIYLEITYYPGSGIIPLQIPSLMKMSMSKTQHYAGLLNGNDNSDSEVDEDDEDDEDKFNNDLALGFGIDTTKTTTTTSPTSTNHHFKSSLMSRLNVDLPPLPDINSPRTYNKKEQLTSKNEKENNSTTTTTTTAADGNHNNGWMSKILETAYTSFFTKPTEIETPNLLLTGISRKKVSRSTFFNDESSDEEEEEEVVKKPVSKGNRRGIKEIVVEEEEEEDDDDDDEVFEVGQRVAFRSSVNSSNHFNSNRRYEESESESESEDEMEFLRKSFQGKPLPTKPIQNTNTRRRAPPPLKQYESESESEEEEEEEKKIGKSFLPSPPTHQIPLTRSMFAAETDKVIKARSNGGHSNSGLSYSQIRRLNQAKNLANSPIKMR